MPGAGNSRGRDSGGSITMSRCQLPGDLCLTHLVAAALGMADSAYPRPLAAAVAIATVGASGAAGADTAVFAPICFVAAELLYLHLRLGRLLQPCLRLRHT